ncbi:MAG: asparaginase [Alphaproteobacteria bacterium]
MPVSSAASLALSRDANPVLVEVTRRPAVESRHRGAAAVVDARGRIVASWGDVEHAVYPRSAIKPLQAIAVIETGAADAYGLGDAELAMCCASHSGEPAHVETVQRWLARIGLGVAALECGAHLPYAPAASEALLRAGQAPTAAHNNCSGKHSGMLSAALHMGEPTKGYVRPDHPAQQRWMRTVGEMCGIDLARAPMGTDGCSIPTLAFPIRAMALGMARLATQEGLDAGRSAAARRVLAAVAARPDMVSGTGRFATVLMERTGGRILVKGGAEGVYCAALPHLGLGLALKIDDGAARAAEVATAAILRRLGALDEADWTALKAVARPVLRNWNGIETGTIESRLG